MRKKRKKIVLYVLVGLIASSSTLFFLRPQAENYFHAHSECAFDPFISDDIKALIQETIVTVANSGLFSLMNKKSHLVAMGDQISEAVTDFAYWAYVFSTPQLARDMKKIQHTSVKYKGFIKGTQNKLVRECSGNPCFLQQAEEFAGYLHLPKEETLAVLKSCLEKSSRDKYAFKQYLDYLIAHKST